MYMYMYMYCSGHFLMYNSMLIICTMYFYMYMYMYVNLHVHVHVKVYLHVHVCPQKWHTELLYQTIILCMLGTFHYPL